MAIRESISSRETGLRFEEEDSPGTLPGSATWKGLEPNSYGAFGRQNTLVARNPITDDRQRRKGVVTTFAAAAEFQSDVTQENMPNLLEGFFYADLRVKDEVTVTAAANSSSTFTVSSGADNYAAGDLFFVEDMSESGNNGLFTVASTSSTTDIVVEESLTDESSASGTGRRVGFEFASGDAEIDASGNLKTSTKDMTDLDLVEGEYIFIGGDTAASQFATAGTGYARVNDAAANLLTLDKASTTFSTDGGGSKEIKIFFAPRVLKNESDPSNIKKKTYQFERQLGAPDDSSPSSYQFEYVEGAVPNTLTFNVPSADKLTADLAYVATGHSRNTTSDGRKSGSTEDADQADAFNTSEDIPRARLAKDGSSSALVDNIATLTVNVNNNVTALDAVGNAQFSTNEGQFAVSGSMDVFLQEIDLLTDIINNEDITFDVHFWRENAGISLDIPCIALGDGRPNVSQGEAVMVPLSIEAATGSKVNDNLTHTALMGWWSYLPDEAMP